MKLLLCLFLGVALAMKDGDQHEMCCGWATMDECNTNSFWMKVNCQGSCGTMGCDVKDAMSDDMSPPEQCMSSVDIEGCPWTREFLEANWNPEAAAETAADAPVEEAAPADEAAPEEAAPVEEAAEEEAVVVEEEEAAEEEAAPTEEAAEPYGTDEAPPPPPAADPVLEEVVEVAAPAEEAAEGMVEEVPAEEDYPALEELEEELLGDYTEEELTAGLEELTASLDELEELTEDLDALMEEGFGEEEFLEEEPLPEEPLEEEYLEEEFLPEEPLEEEFAEEEFAEEEPLPEETLPEETVVVEAEEEVAEAMVEESAGEAPMAQDAAPQKDADESCCGWAAFGECDNNPAWMVLNCPYYCGASPDCNEANAATCERVDVTAEIMADCPERVAQVEQGLSLLPVEGAASSAADAPAEAAPEEAAPAEEAPVEEEMEEVPAPYRRRLSHRRRQ